jgi:hypothetical protein
LADSNTGKPVLVDGNVVGELVAVFQDGDDLVEQLRKRAAYIGLSYGLIDELTGLGEGGVGKYLAPVRGKQLTMTSMLRIAEVLGVKALFYVDDIARREDVAIVGKARWRKGAC